MELLYLKEVKTLWSNIKNDRFSTDIDAFKDFLKHDSNIKPEKAME